MAYLLRELPSGGETDYPEEKLVQGFVLYLKRLKPRLLSYNERSLNFPVLKYRDMAFPGKFGADGSKVASMIVEGRVQEVRDNFCETDFLNTYLVYPRYQMHAGNLCLASYNCCIANVFSLIKSTKDEQLNRGSFLKAWCNACKNKYTI